jgi:hypothetical protein
LVFSRLLKNAHLLRFPHPSSLRRMPKYASGRLTNSSAWQESLLIRRDATLRISGALHLSIFEQPAENDFFRNLLDGFAVFGGQTGYGRICSGVGGGVGFD